MAVVACGGDTVDQATISGGGTEGSTNGEPPGIDTGADATRGDDTGAGSGDASSGGDADSDGPLDDTGGDGGVGGDQCQGTQSGLCEDPGTSVHCYSGAEGTCGIGACVGGTQMCITFDLDLGEWTACEGEVTPAAEICDGIDNDCDGQTDEDLGQTTCGEGLCQHSEDDCVDGRANACDPMLGAVAEECDGEDNDCDGDIDEDFAGQETTCGLGQCLHAVAACVDGVVPTCDPLEGATPEACDGVDNDCDDEIDEGLGDLTCGLGVCEQTVPACVGGVPQVCDPFAGAGAEICDGLDNDCDGQIDEGFGTVTCGQGICAHDIETCVDGAPTICDPFLGAVAEICFDDLDNDCDGTVDENCNCGNGALDAGEDCDGANLGGSTCASLGNDGGTLACTADCQFDTSGCYDCGDGVINGAEACDGAALGGQTCISLGYDGGALSCSAACQLVENGCYACGDGTIDPGESCDGVNFGGATCVSLGYDGGSLACAGCTIDPSGCYECGDGTIDAGEQCDGASLNGQTCASLGYDAGTLACNGACNFNVTGCWTCGNGVINPGESCDLGALGGATCQSLGFAGGTLGCDSACDHDTSGCWECGDGAVNPGELCDGANLNGQTCVTLGHAGGTLSCTNGCAFNQNGCFDCGNGVINAPEQCDGANLNGQTCVTQGYLGGTLTCNANCTYNASGCHDCGNGTVDAGEDCEGLDFGGLDCEDYGFAYGNLACTATCDIDLSGCTNVCSAPVQAPCDAPNGNQMQALGLNCATTTLDNWSFTSPAASAWRVAAEYGNSGAWTAREGNALLVASTGTLPPLNAANQVVLAANATQIGTANANPGAFPLAVALPAPISPVDGSNNGAGGTPYVNCDGVDDCSDTLDAAWATGGFGAFDLIWWQFTIDVPAGTSAYAFDIAWFDAEYPEWIGSNFTDVFVVWSQSEAYVGNIMVYNNASFSSNTAAPFVNYSGADPELAGTGYGNVGGATGWYTVTGPTVPSETITLTFAHFETGDDFYDGTVLVDNFVWDCDGCIMGVDCLMTPAQ